MERYIQVLDKQLKPVGGNINLSPGMIIKKEDFDLTPLSNGDFVVSWSGAIEGNDQANYSIIQPGEESNIITKI